jgi:bacillolysin
VTQPELIIYGALDRPSRLAWKLRLEISLAARWVVVIDGLNGQILTAFNSVPHENVAGSGQDLAGITRPLNVWHGNTVYYLLDTSKPMYDPSSVPPQSGTTRGAIIILDANNQPPTADPSSAPIQPSLYFSTSGSVNSGWLPDGVSVAYNFSAVYDYYRVRHGRNSINGQGGNITAVVRYGLNFANAFWSSEANAMYFGDAKPYAGALDVVAHEMTHGVTSNSANLMYQNQSGALNEAFSDIMGEMVEAYATGTTDWLLGESLGAPMRNFSDPGSLSSVFGAYPAKMSQYYKLPTGRDGDNGGVHINSSIINHAYYLLARGMSGSIGIPDAERIFYRALTMHLTQQSEFIDARLACIQSAKELFGATSMQAVRVAEAFDAVEIFDSAPLPVPNPAPPVSGSDATLFVSFDPTYGAMGDYRLARRESALGDGTLGNWLSSSAIKSSRPSVTADGSLAAFVKANNDLCLISTNDATGGTTENCIGMPGSVHSVAMSPDGNRFGFVLLDQYGNRENKISVVDLAANTTSTYPLVAPTSAGITINSIDYADTLVFSANSRYVVYDAFNVLRGAAGSTVGAWSIYAIDLTTSETLIVVPPREGFDIGYPAIGHTSDDFIVFEAVTQSTGQSTILAGNTRTGTYAVVGTVSNSYAVPAFSGDDSAVLYSVPDAAQVTGYSIFRQPLAGDHVTPAGSPALWLNDADSAVVYRRGAYHKLAVSNTDTTSGVVTSSVGGINCGDSCSFIYPAGTTVSLTARTNTRSLFAGWGGACSGTGTCTVTLSQDQAVTANFKSTYALMVNTTGAGSGTVTGVPVDINNAQIACMSKLSTNCRGTFAAGTQVTLMPVITGGSIFGGWSSNCTLHGPDCRITLSADTTVTATFNSASTLLVQLLGAPVRTFGFIQLAYNSAGSSGVIKAQAVTLVENLLLNVAGRSITFKGGYDAGFAIQTGYTTVLGKLTLGQGSLIADRLVIR